MALASFVGLAFTAGACKTKSSTAPVVELSFSDRLGIGVTKEKRLTESWARELAKHQLEKQLPGFELRDARSDEVPWQMQITLHLVEAPGPRVEDGGVVPQDEIFRGVGATVELAALRADPKTHERTRYEASSEASGNTPLFEDFKPLAENAISGAIGLIKTEIELRGVSDESLVERLSDPDVRVRSRVIDEVHRRRTAAALPKLLEMMADDDAPPEIIFSVIGALVAIGDRRAVGPLIDSARRRSSMYLGQIIFGVAKIGGKEAEAYLFTVASGHPDPKIRKNAKDALREMELSGGGENEAEDE